MATEDEVNQTETNQADQQGSTENNSVAGESTDADAEGEGDGGGSTSTQTGFCGAEQRISFHTCNSLHPAAAIDPFGNIANVWHDTRDGAFEIYMKVLESQIDKSTLNLAADTFIDPASGRTINLPSGYSGMMALEDICELTNESESTEVVARLSAGRLDIDSVNRRVTLTATENVDFEALGVLPNSRIKILNRINAGKQFAVFSVPAPNVLDLVYYDGIQDDEGFAYVVQSNPSPTVTDCETRLTFGASTSVNPDIVADSVGRYQIVYQDNESGHYEIKSIEVFRACDGQRKCDGPVDLSGQITVAATQSDSAAGSSGSAPAANPKDGQPFFHGNRNLPDPIPAASADPLARNGMHRVFRLGGETQWVAVSRAEDRPTWDAQAADLGITDLPTYVADAGVPLANEGDFGEVVPFRELAFMVQTPADMKVEISKVILPIKPRCAPSSFPQGDVQQRTQDLISAPKRPVPVGFSDPVSLEQVLGSPLATIDESLPPRFTVDGDPTGTVFTNVVVGGQDGEQNRLVFVKEPNCSEDKIKFILGQRRCGSELCAVRSSGDEASLAAPKTRYGVKLTVWAGPDYRADASQAEQPQLSGAKLYENRFEFELSESLNTFVIPDGLLVAPAGRYIFFSVEPDSDLGMYVDGVGGGHTVWFSDGNGFFTQHYSSFTIGPNAGMSAPVYYEGFLGVDNTDVPGGGGGSSDGSTGPGFLKEVATDFVEPIGLAYQASSGKMILSANYPTGAPHALEVVDAQGVHAPFSTLANLTDEVKLASPRTAAGGFTVGEVFMGSGQPGVIVRVSADGQTIDNPWVALPGETGLIRGSLHFDTTGVFDNKLVVVTTTGGVWLVGSDRAATRLANLKVHLEGVVTIPSIASKYGPWAGKILIGAEQEGLFWSVDAKGNTESYNLGLAPEDIEVIPENENLYLIGFGDKKLYAATPENFIGRTGDILACEEETGKLFHIMWNGSEFKKTLIINLGSHIEHMTFSPMGIKNIPPSEDDNDDGGEEPTACDDPRLIASDAISLTKSPGDSKHPRLAVDKRDNMWMVFESNRTGSDEVYVAKFFAPCGKWNTSGQGGSETRLSNAGANGKAARSPNVAVDSKGEAHVVYSSDDTEDGRSEIFYTRSMAGGRTFTPPIRLTASAGSAVMPDIVVSTEDDKEKVTVVWHDDRFGNYEIMSAYKVDGVWVSSGQGSSDTRITAAPGDSLFPRIAADKKGNIRVVYHDFRNGLETGGIFMSTYVASAGSWDSSGQGGVDRLISVEGTKNSLHPDIAIDKTNGVFVNWHDDRLADTEPDLHEEIFGVYCPRLDAPSVHFPPIVKSEYTKLDVEVKVVDCVEYQPLTTTNVPEVCVSIKSPGATFYRISNEDSAFSDWIPFKPKAELDTIVIPWVLSCGNGRKQVCVQVQDAQFIGFPVCYEVSVQAPLPTFKIEFFSDPDLTKPLASYGNKPVAPEGDVYVKITSCAALVRPPTFDVVSRGIHMVRNQETVAMMGTSGFSSGIGSFLGTNTGSAFSALAGNTYKGRFHVFKDDGLFHKDGHARVIVHGKDARGNSF
jgi:hypothetical protein